MAKNNFLSWHFFVWEPFQTYSGGGVEILEWAPKRRSNYFSLGRISGADNKMPRGVNSQEYFIFLEAVVLEQSLHVFSFGAQLHISLLVS